MCLISSFLNKVHADNAYAQAHTNIHLVHEFWVLNAFSPKPLLLLFL